MYFYFIFFLFFFIYERILFENLFGQTKKYQQKLINHMGARLLLKVVIRGTIFSQIERFTF